MISSYSLPSSFLHSSIYRSRLIQYVMLSFSDSLLPSIWFLHHSTYPCAASCLATLVSKAEFSSSLQTLWSLKYSTDLVGHIPRLCWSLAFDYLRMQLTSSLYSLVDHWCSCLLGLGLLIGDYMKLVMSYGFSWWRCTVISSPWPLKEKADSWRTLFELLSVDAWHHSGRQLICLVEHELVIYYLFDMDTNGQKEQLLRANNTESSTNYWFVCFVRIDHLFSE